MTFTKEATLVGNVLMAPTFQLLDCKTGSAVLVAASQLAVPLRFAKDVPLPKRYFSFNSRNILYKQLEIEN